MMAVFFVLCLCELTESPDECLKHNEMKASANSNINTSTYFEKVERTSLICDYF